MTDDGQLDDILEAFLKSHDCTKLKWQKKRYNPGDLEHRVAKQKLVAWCAAQRRDEIESIIILQDGCPGLHARDKATGSYIGRRFATLSAEVDRLGPPTTPTGEPPASQKTSTKGTDHA